MPLLTAALVLVPILLPSPLGPLIDWRAAFVLPHTHLLATGSATAALLILSLALDPDHRRRSSART